MSDLLVPQRGVWWGATANPLDGESWDSALVSLESTLGHPLDIAHFYHASPQLFPTHDEIARARQPGHRRILLLNWKPEMGRTWAQVAAGDPEVDAAIDREAAHLRENFTEPFFLDIHHEPEDEVDPTPGSGMTADDYAAMYRRVVTRVRAAGVKNAVTVMNWLGTPFWGSQPWFGNLYAGDDVVDWIAQDPYIFDATAWSGPFDQAVDRTDARYPGWPGFATWARANHPDKPMMLAEWGVDEALGSERKAEIVAGVAGGLARFPQLKALVYWNSRDFHPVGTTRVDSSPAALAAFRVLLDSPAVTGARPPSPPAGP